MLVVHHIGTSVGVRRCWFALATSALGIAIANRRQVTLTELVLVLKVDCASYW